MYVALHRGYYHLRFDRNFSPTGRALHVRLEYVYGLLHHLCRLNHLRQEHLSVAEEAAYALHSVHQRPFYYAYGAAIRGHTGRQVCFERVRLALHKSLGQPLFGRCRGGWCRLSAVRLGVSRLRLGLRYLGGFGYEPLGCALVGVENHVFDAAKQGWFNAVIYLKHCRIDYCHVESGPYCVVEEGRVHGLAHGVVAAEGERQVGDSARSERPGQVVLNPADGLYEVYGVPGVLADARAYGQHVDVEDDVVRLYAGLLGK